MDFGIRIVFAACDGETNLFYEQPDDLSDGFFTPEGWRLYGGHRMWPAPESDLCTAPDNLPISWVPEENGVQLTQLPDGRTGLQKMLRIQFSEDGRILLEHSFQNISGHVLSCASWGINSMAAGGVAKIEFPLPEQSSFQPQRAVMLWQDTSLDDPRLSFTKDALTVTHLPLDAFCKLGLFSRSGRVVFENLRQRFTLTFPAVRPERLADHGCNFELYLCRHFMELETLGELVRLMPGDTASHWEAWRFEHLE